MVFQTHINNNTINCNKNCKTFLRQWITFPTVSSSVNGSTGGTPSPTPQSSIWFFEPRVQLQPAKIPSGMMEMIKNSDIKQINPDSILSAWVKERKIIHWVKTFNFILKVFFCNEISISVFFCLFALASLLYTPPKFLHWKTHKNDEILICCLGKFISFRICRKFFIGQQM